MAGSGRPWGWHRLADRWAARVVAASGVRPGELVVDLGAGDGALTAALVARGATVIAVERHPSRVRVLRERFAGAPVRVVAADLESFRLPNRPFRVVANPPYALMVATVRRLTAHPSSLHAADLVLPASFVAQVVGGRLAAARWEYSRGCYVPRNAFVPPPAVDSAVLVVRRAPGASRRRR